MTRQRVESSIVIEAPIDAVWEVTSDPTNFVEAIDWVYEAHIEGNGSLDEGAVYVERAKPGLREGTYRWEITAWDPPRRAVHSHSGPELAADLEIRLEELGDARTRYTQTMEFVGLPAFRPLGFIIERIAMKPQMQRDMDQMILPNFKRMAEERHRSHA